MTANSQFHLVQENRRLRGFSNLFKKENQAWWKTRRWWINLILWAGILGGLVIMMLFILPPLAEATNDPNVAEMGGPIPFALEMGRTVFFELGTMAVAIGVIILSLDLIIDEKDSGVAEWILSKPVARRSYILAKLAANTIAILLLLLVVPGMIVYGLFYLRSGDLFPVIPFLSAMGMMTVHAMFYLTLTVMAGTLFNNRAGVLAVSFGTLFGGAMLGGFLQPLLFATPWNLARTASAVASSAPIPTDIVLYPILFTVLWSVLFGILAIWRFNKAEF
jgi:ABC-2 type transport system permease protein